MGVSDIDKSTQRSHKDGWAGWTGIDRDIDQHHSMGIYMNMH